MENTLMAIVFDTYRQILHKIKEKWLKWRLWAQSSLMLTVQQQKHSNDHHYKGRFCEIGKKIAFFTSSLLPHSLQYKKKKYISGCLNRSLLDLFWFWKTNGLAANDSSLRKLRTLKTFYASLSRCSDSEIVLATAHRYTGPVVTLHRHRGLSPHKCLCLHFSIASGKNSIAFTTPISSDLANFLVEFVFVSPL